MDYYRNANGRPSNLWSGSLDDSDVHSSLRIISIGSFMKFSENFETNIQGQVPHKVCSDLLSANSRANSCVSVSRIIGE